MDREIVVRGEGEVTTLPDYAVIDATVEALSASRDTAYDRAAASAAQVDEVIAARRGAFRSVKVANLAVQPTSRWDNGERRRTGWRASRTVSLEVRDLDQLAVLIATLVSAGAAISGPRWAINDTNPVFREARKRAAAEAWARAEDYAGALGVELGGVAWVAEPGLRGPTGGGGGGPLRTFAAAAPPAPPDGSERDPDEIIDVSPEEITVSATVEVGFVLLGD